MRTEELFDDQFVCVRCKTRAGTAPRVTIEQLANLDHVLVVSPGTGQGTVDHALARTGRSRHIAAYVPQFLVAPDIVAATDLVLTTGRHIAEKLASPLGLEVFASPVSLRPFAVRMLWHPRTEDDSVVGWLRSIMRKATARLLAA